MIFRFTVGFSGRSQGWSEIYYIDNAATSPRLLVSLFQAFAQKRADFLGSPYQIVFGRISQYSTAPGIRAPRKSFPVKQVFSSSHPSLTRGAEPADVSLDALFSNGVASFGAIVKMGAPPDDAVDNGGIVDLGKANLGTDLDNFTAFVIANGFGWNSVGGNYDNEIDSLTQTTDGRVSIKLKAPQSFPPVATTWYPARIRGLNQGKSILNRQVLVTQTALDTVETKERIAFQLPQVGGAIKLYNQIGTFQAADAVDVALEVGNHRRGRPFGTSPGRRSKQVLS